MRTARAIIFDAYGTLLDVSGAMAAHAARIGPQWPRISVEWRAKQLEYSWVRSLTGPAHHEDFWLCTRDALDVVMHRHGLHDAGLKRDLLEAYRVLAAYPEVPAMLRALQAADIPSAILSNGSPWMLESAVAAAGIGDLLDAVLSVEELGVFKPDPRVYQLACRQFGVAAAEMIFVSSNTWDAQAAAHAGYQVVRINRDQAPDEYGLAAMLLAELPDLSSLPELAGI
ncbi:MAG: haloacid dehalogenase type II [Rubritepida sp.]|nr:haloacid dehalogenase type II [Rubritepida sp.]